MARVLYEQVVVLPSAETVGDDGSPEVAPSVSLVPFVSPIEQIRRLSASSGRLVPRIGDTTNEYLNAIFVDGLRSSYRRRLTLTLEETPGFCRVMEVLTRADVDRDIADVDGDIADINREMVEAMIQALFGIVQLAVHKIDESIAREHAERARDSLRFDPLTGLISQTAFNGYGPAVFDQLAEEGRLMAYIVFDIDGFKAVNDSGGHPAGDHVLAELGKIIRKQLRGDDIPVRNGDYIPARNGGDEFVIVLPDTSLVEAVNIAERIRKAVESHEFIYKDQHELDHEFKITLSIGVGTRQPEDTFTTLHKRTDALSYASKRNGKNCISVALPEGMDVSAFPDSVNVVTAAGRPN